MIKDKKILLDLYRLRALGYEYIEKLNNAKQIDSLHFQSTNIDALNQMIKKCHMCNLAKTRKNIVCGEGNVNAKLMFVGEAPGASEDEAGRPFVGRAGELLDKIIQNVLELPRSSVYIANIIKCRPPNNRVPSSDEVALCKPFVLQQIKLINPSIIVALGATAFRYLMENDDVSISKVRGEVFDFGSAKLIPTFHPSYLLRNPSAKKDVFHDMLKVKSLL